MTKINNLEELLLDELRDLYSAETQLIKALPKMAEAAADPDLKEAFESHLTQTREHAERLLKSFEFFGESEDGKTCLAMKGLVDEGTEAIKLKGPAAVRDANLIGAAQRVEHYEMAGYGCARAFAEKLGKREVADLLQATLNEEGEANKRLTAIAESVNEDALSATSVS